MSQLLVLPDSGPTWLLSGKLVAKYLAPDLEKHDGLVRTNA